VREFRSRGSVRGAVGNDRPYREPMCLMPRLARCPEYPESRHEARAQCLTRWPDSDMQLFRFYVDLLLDDDWKREDKRRALADL